MDLLQMGAQLLKNQLNTKQSQDGVASALGQLLGAQNSNQVDLVSLLGKLAGNGGIQQMLGSFLKGGGAGDLNINAAQIIQLFGDSKLGVFANALGVTNQDAAGGLASALPELLKVANSGKGGAASLVGGLMNNAGGLGGILGALKK